MRHLAVLSTLAALSLAACSGGDAPLAPSQGPSRIVNGEPTGAPIRRWARSSSTTTATAWTAGDQWCTGSLVSPTVFVTSAHCVITPYTPPGSQFYVSFSPDLFGKGFRAIAATGYKADPKYGHDQANLHDLAVVFLPASATRGMTPLKLPTAGLLDGLAAKGSLSKQLFVNVGYGVSATRTGVPGFSWDGKRNYSKSEFMGLQPTWLGLLMNTSATGEGGDCYGDSGGPKFLDGDPTTILATVTTGDYNCRATTWDWRLDTPEARAFLAPFVRLP
jgi:hypothetical protein